MFQSITRIIFLLLCLLSRIEDQIIPEKGELLNADLRIFALIRLGITDNDYYTFYFLQGYTR